ncbi:MAG: hypothetical protein U0835_24410 [Isosphaeraceae bacterium]
MFRVFQGVDFSGAKLAGRAIWIARLEMDSPEGELTTFRLTELASLEKLCGSAEREPALRHLRGRIERSEQTLWALDFPFGLPVELFPPRSRWVSQFRLLKEWGDDAYGMGVECLRRAKALGGPNHIRRQTDLEAKAPFDCYHYRIIYQTFFGMRDVLGPLRNDPSTAILPFHYGRLPGAKRVLVEACPSSTLKRLGLPHQNYKQPEGGALTPRRRSTRRVILEALQARVEIPPSFRQRMMRNPGGDALDSVLAALGAAESWAVSDHIRVAKHRRYPREGRLYV